MTADSPNREMNRERIVRAAIELLDAEGVEGLSMRRLGRRLGSGATSSYWYVGSKDELVALAAEYLVGDLALPDPGDVGWRAAAAAMAHDLRAMILRHPWLAPIFGSQPTYGPRIARYENHALAVYEAAGFAGADLGRAADTVAAFVLGMTLGEAALKARLCRGGVNAAADASDLIAAVRQTVAPFPRLRDRYDAMAYDAVAGADLEVVREQSFEFGLQTVLDGLAARLAGAP